MAGSVTAHSAVATKVYLVKISFVPAIRRTVARHSEITLTAKCLLPKFDPTTPPMIAAAARIRPSEGTE